MTPESSPACSIVSHFADLNIHSRVHKRRKESSFRYEKIVLIMNDSDADMGLAPPVAFSEHKNEIFSLHNFLVSLTETGEQLVYMLRNLWDSHTYWPKKGTFRHETTN
jgi:hypothetical protein